jgi:hypothetical protein
MIKHISGYEVDSPDKIAKKLIKTGKFEAVKKTEPKPVVKGKK